MLLFQWDALWLSRHQPLTFQKDVLACDRLLIRQSTFYSTLWNRTFWKLETLADLCVDWSTRYSSIQSSRVIETGLSLSVPFKDAFCLFLNFIGVFCSALLPRCCLSLLQYWVFKETAIFHQLLLTYDIISLRTLSRWIDWGAVMLLEHHSNRGPIRHDLVRIHLSLRTILITLSKPRVFLFSLESAMMDP